MAKKSGDADNSSSPGGSGSSGGGPVNSDGSGGQANTNTQTGSNIPSNTPSPNDLTGPLTRYIGRVAVQPQYGALMSWPGTGAQITFSGTQLQIGMTNQQPGMPNYVDVFIDQNLVSTISINDQQPNNLYPITVSGDGLHTATVIKRTDPFMGHMLFQGFSTNGAINPNTLARPARLIEFIGDNVAAGYGSDGPVGNPNSCPSGTIYPTNARFNGASNAFPVLTARALNADWSVVAYLARGVAYNLDGSMGGTLPNLYPMQNPLDVDNGLWDFKVTADVVVINAGTSDINYWFTNTGHPPIDKAGFVAAYAAFLGQIRQKNANAQIIATLGPMLSQYTCPPGATLTAGNCVAADGSSQQSALALGREMVQSAIAKAGDSRVTYLEFPASSQNLSCDYHPDRVGQQAIADALVPAIRKVAGWSS